MNKPEESKQTHHTGEAESNEEKTLESWCEEHKQKRPCYCDVLNQDNHKGRTSVI